MAFLSLSLILVLFSLFSMVGSSSCLCGGCWRESDGGPCECEEPRIGADRRSPPPQQLQVHLRAWRAGRRPPALIAGRAPGQRLLALARRSSRDAHRGGRIPPSPLL